MLRGLEYLRDAGVAPDAHVADAIELVESERVFEIDVLACPWCRGKRKLLALVTEGKVVRRILEHVALPTPAPALAPARSPPVLEFAG